MALVVRTRWRVSPTRTTNRDTRRRRPAAAPEPEIGSGSELRELVDADVLPSGTTIIAGDGSGQQVAQVLPDGKLYSDGETYDGLAELSDVLGVEGNPWSRWSAELADGRILLRVLREAHVQDADAGT